MKKTKQIIFGIAAMLLISFIGNAQTDSIAVINPDAINSEVKEILLPSIFNILGSVGVSVTPFAGLITFVIMFIIRAIEKKNSKQKTANAIKEVLTTPTPQGQAMPTKHTSLLWKVIDKLEGKKTQ